MFKDLSYICTLNLRLVKFKIFGIFVLIMMCFVSIAQDAHFSQAPNNYIYLNPANAGFGPKTNRVLGLYRDQYRTAFATFSTTFMSYDRRLVGWGNGWQLGGGVDFLYDKIGNGIISTFSPNISLAIGKYFNQGRQLLNIGISTGFAFKKLNYSNLTFDNQYIPLIGFDPNSSSGEQLDNKHRIYPNLNFGINFSTALGNYSKLDIGGALANLHQPNQSFLANSISKLPARYTSYIKAVIGFANNEKWNLQPAFVYNFQNKAQNILVIANVETKFKETNKGNYFGLGFGAGYRIQDNDAMIANISVLLGDLRIATSYDFNISKYKPATKGFGAFELSLSYEWGEHENAQRSKNFKFGCPVVL